MAKVLLWRAGNDLVGKCIRYFTESEWAHVAVFADGFTFEEAAKGAEMTLHQKESEKVLICPVEGIQEAKIADWCEDQVTAHLRYNVFLLIALAFVYPLRWFFDKLNWVPFRAQLFGEVCSTFVDQAFKAAGIDLFPERGEDATVPGDFIKCRLLREE
jgi:hypothetical protein